MNVLQKSRSGREIAEEKSGYSVAFWRFRAYWMIGLSLYFLAHAAYDEQRGISAPPYVPGIRWH
jgi:hypothetical protein